MTRRAGTTVTPARLRRWPLPQPGGDTDKDARGRVLVVGGTRGLVGAVRLAGEAALRAGAGKLQLASVRGAGIPLSIAVPEARVFEMPTDADGALSGPGRDLPRAAADADAVLVGPGMSADPRTNRLVAALAARSAATVLDAGAIAALRSPAVRRAFAARRDTGDAAALVITPHFGEMATLRGIDIAGIDADPPAHAREVAREHRCIVVLKSATTWIADPAGALWRHDDGPPGLATSGSGDVLAGVIAGLLARGAAPAQAAVWAVALHAAAGRDLARHRALGGLARELPAAIAAAAQRLAGSPRVRA